MEPPKGILNMALLYDNGAFQSAQRRYDDMMPWDEDDRTPGEIAEDNKINEQFEIDKWGYG
jgi:hypothetical protein